MPRRVAASLLDLAFERSSPLPVLVQDAGSSESDAFIVVPPLAMLQPGNQSHQGLVQLVTIARGLGARSVLEIGTYNGLTALTLAMNLPDVVIDTLDLPAGDSAASSLGLGSAEHAGRPELDTASRHLLLTGSSSTSATPRPSIFKG